LLYIYLDLLNDDFDYKYTLKIKSAGPSNTTVTTVTQFDEKEVKLSPKISLKWAHPTGFAVDKLEAAADGKVAVETSLVNVAPGLKLEFKGKDADKADLSLTYAVPAATVTADLDLSNFSSANAAFTAGSGPITAGASANLKLAKSSLDSATFGVGLAYTMPKQFLFVARADNNLSNYTAHFSYAGLKNVTLAGLANYAGKDPSATVGLQYACNPCTSVKVKVNTAGVLSASIKQALDTKFNVVGSAEFRNNLSNLKLGLNATLG
jgi:hypothetical protein